MKYYRLLDKFNFNDVIRENNGNIEIYCFGVEEWKPYIPENRCQDPDDPYFDEQEIISSREAKFILTEQRNKLNSLLAKAIEIAVNAHRGQTDKGDIPYVFHLQTVAGLMDETEHKIVAWLHDTLEDTSVTVEDLVEQGFTPRIVRSVQLLTKTPNVRYDTYISKIKDDSIARFVKSADLHHNMDLTRIRRPAKPDIERTNKYRKALAALNNFVLCDRSYRTKKFESMIEIIADEFNLDTIHFGYHIAELYESNTRYKCMVLEYVAEQTSDLNDCLYTLDDIESKLGNPNIIVLSKDQGYFVWHNHSLGNRDITCYFTQGMLLTGVSFEV